MMSTHTQFHISYIYLTGITFDLSNPQQEEEGERAIVHIPSPNHLSLSWNLGVFLIYKDEDDIETER